MSLKLIVMEQNSVLNQVIQIVLGYACAEKIALIGYIDSNGKPRFPFKDDFTCIESLREANSLLIVCIRQLNSFW